MSHNILLHFGNLVPFLLNRACFDHSGRNERKVYKDAKYETKQNGRTVFVFIDVIKGGECDYFFLIYWFIVCYNSLMDKRC